jgi:hypothetical protein
LQIFSNKPRINTEEVLFAHGRKNWKCKTLNDTMPFTMSANVLTEPYKAQYLNVYEKAHLLECARYLINREKSNGKGILDLMQKII